jgi:hypothetical protein
LVLGSAALAAIVLSRIRPSPAENKSGQAAAAYALAVATVIQAIHFSEEALTGFPQRLGELLGLPAMPMSFFLTFNLAWLAIWIASVPGLRSGRGVAFFAAWFLAIAGVLNAIAHPLLAVTAGGYFPGLVTSPVIGAAGVMLWRRLREATEHAAR